MQGMALLPRQEYWSIPGDMGTPGFARTGFGGWDPWMWSSGSLVFPDAWVRDIGHFANNARFISV